MKTYLKIVATLFAFALSSPALAASAITPLSVAIVPPVQFPSADFMVAGLRLSLIYGHHRDVFGLDLGLVGNITDQSFGGVALSGGFNNLRGDANILGLQFAGLANLNYGKTAVYGLQASLGINYQTAASHVVGIQFAMANLAQFTDVYGAQAGIYNRANEVYGFQIGLVNVAENLHGVQIGLINFNNKGLISVCPILNIGF